MLVVKNEAGLSWLPYERSILSLTRGDLIALGAGEGLGRNFTSEDIKKDKRSFAVKKQIAHSIDDIVLPSFASRGNILERVIHFDLNYLALTNDRSASVAKKEDLYPVILVKSPVIPEILKFSLKYVREVGRYTSLVYQSYDVSEYSQNESIADQYPQKNASSPHFAPPSVFNQDHKRVQSYSLTQSLSVQRIAAVSLQNDSILSVSKTHTEKKPYQSQTILPLNVNIVGYERQKPRYELSEKLENKAQQVPKTIVQGPDFQVSISYPNILSPHVDRVRSQSPIFLAPYRLITHGTFSEPVARQDRVWQLTPYTAALPATEQIHRFNYASPTHIVKTPPVPILATIGIPALTKPTEILFPQINTENSSLIEPFKHIAQKPHVVEKIKRQLPTYERTFAPTELEHLACTIESKYGCSVSFKVIDLNEKRTWGRKDADVIPPASVSKLGLIYAAMTLAQEGQLNLEQTINVETMLEKHPELRPRNVGEKIQGDYTIASMLEEIVKDKNRGSNAFANILLKTLGAEKVNVLLREHGYLHTSFSSDAPYTPKGDYHLNTTTLEEAAQLMAALGNGSQWKPQYQQTAKQVLSAAKNWASFLFGVRSDKENTPELLVKHGQTENAMSVAYKFKGENGKEFVGILSMTNIQGRLVEEDYRKATKIGVLVMNDFVQLSRSIYASFQSASFKYQ